MNIPITTTGVLFILTIAGAVFGIYHYFKKPQDQSEKDGIKLADRISSVEKELYEVKQTHLLAMEKDLKSLTDSVNELSRTVVRLSTIIDERIPKGTTAK